MSSHSLGELEAYCYMVKRGGKPAASLALQDRYLEAANQIVEENGLSIYVEDLAPGWVTVWVYKYPHVLEVIKAVPQAPTTVFDHWVLGKLFGYSEESIRDFVESTAPS